MALAGLLALLSGLRLVLQGVAEAGVPLLREIGKEGWHHAEVPSPMEVPKLCRLKHEVSRQSCWPFPKAGAPLLRGTGKEGWHHTDVPSPMEAPELCRLNASGALCDVDGILSPGGRAEALAILRQVREETAAPCGAGAKGYQVGVALVRRMHSDDWVRGDAQETAKQFAAKIGDRWGVGEKGCNNGIMVFLSTGDRAAYIKTAPGSQGALTDQRALLVLEKMKPLLREGRVFSSSDSDPAKGSSSFGGGDGFELGGGAGITW